MPVVRVVSGDTWTISAELIAANGGPASPNNSYVEFCLSENQFSPPLWTGEWLNGILPDGNRPGLVHVKIPQEFTKTLRRGSYMFSMRVADKTKFYFDTQLAGNFLVEYMPTSDHRSIPYRDGTSEIFGGSGSSVSGESSGSSKDKVISKILDLIAKVSEKSDANKEALERQSQSIADITSEVSEVVSEVSRLAAQMGGKVDEQDFDTFDGLSLQDTATQHEIKTMLQQVLEKLQALNGEDGNG